MGIFGFLRRNKMERPGFQLYGAAVLAARAPYFYTSLGVPDTLDGRFDLVGLHTFLLIRRLRLQPPPGPALAQAVFDAMFNDMDLNLRELGVSDLAVGKRVRDMWEAFHGRSAAYEEAISAGSPDLLAEALERNVWRGEPAAASARVLARVVYAQDAALARQDTARLLAGEAVFAPATELAA